jgi:hypothetical protein
MSIIKSKLGSPFRLRVPIESGKYGSRWSNKGDQQLSTSHERTSRTYTAQTLIQFHQRKELGVALTTGHTGAQTC